MIRQRLARTLVRKEPWQLWNAFVSLLAEAPYSELSDIQRHAHLAFHYDAEVNNGGHLQYFLNRGRTAAITIPALRSLDLHEQAAVLDDALTQWQYVARQEPGDSAEYCQIALEGEFDDFDQRYHECSPPVNQVLEKLLETNAADFVEIIDVA